MIQSSPSAIDRGLPPPPPIQFYSIELTPLEGGTIAVGIGATLCEATDDAEFELVHMDVANERVDTIDQALGVIREAVTSTMPN
jgi:hypothetical protein